MHIRIPHLFPFLCSRSPSLQLRLYLQPPHLLLHRQLRQPLLCLQLHHLLQLPQLHLHLQPPPLLVRLQLSHLPHPR